MGIPIPIVQMGKLRLRKKVSCPTSQSWEVAWLDPAWSRPEHETGRTDASRQPLRQRLLTDTLGWPRPWRPALQHQLVRLPNPAMAISYPTRGSHYATPLLKPSKELPVSHSREPRLLHPALKASGRMASGPLAQPFPLLPSTPHRRLFIPPPKTLLIPRFTFVSAASPPRRWISFLPLLHPTNFWVSFNFKRCLSLRCLHFSLM